MFVGEKTLNLNSQLVNVLICKAARVVGWRAVADRGGDGEPPGHDGNANHLSVTRGSRRREPVQVRGVRIEKAGVR